MLEEQVPVTFLIMSFLCYTTEMKKIVAVVGPTASGKSALAISLAEKFNGEVVSVDSRAIYKGFPITTAAVTEKEARGIPHHLFGIWNVRENYSISDFQKIAMNTVRDIHSREKLPILAGGTGFYLDSILYENTFPEVPPNPDLRRDLEIKSTKELYDLIERKDSKRAQTLDPLNKVRLVRALEIIDTLGHVPTLPKQAPRYDALIIGITRPDSELRERIRSRIEIRLDRMIAEIKSEGNNLTEEQANFLGFDFTLTRSYLKNDMSRDELIDRLTFGDWQYSRRQLRWFKRDSDVKWFSPADTDAIFSEIQKFLID
jgi:tRNA dimethylallyltransferase